MRVSFVRTIGSKHIEWEINISLSRRRDLKIIKDPNKFIPSISLWNKFTQGVDREYDYKGYIKHSTYIMKL